MIEIDGSRQKSWVEESRHCLRDLIIKKVCMAILFSLNMAAIGAALYFIIAYVPIPDRAFISTPFIIGVIGAIYYLKMPTLGINSRNYSYITNPAVQVGKAIAFLFFGPYMLIENKFDQTPYYHPDVANGISEHLTSWPFDKINKEHGAHFNNLYKYGFIDEETLIMLKRLSRDLEPIEWHIKLIEKRYHLAEESESQNQSSERLGQLYAKKEEINGNWVEFREGKLATFPKALVPDCDPSKKWDRCLLTAEDFFLDPRSYLPNERDAVHLLST